MLIRADGTEIGEYAEDSLRLRILVVRRQAGLCRSGLRARSIRHCAFLAPGSGDTEPEDAGQGGQAKKCRILAHVIERMLAGSKWFVTFAEQRECEGSIY